MLSAVLTGGWGSGGGGGTLTGQWQEAPHVLSMYALCLKILPSENGLVLFVKNETVSKIPLLPLRTSIVLPADRDISFQVEVPAASGTGPGATMALGCSRANCVLETFKFFSCVPLPSSVFFPVSSYAPAQTLGPSPGPCQCPYFLLTGIPIHR